MALLFTRLPGGFLPEEDQGMMIALVQGPPGGTLPRTQKALDVVNDHFLKDEKANVESVFTVSGFSFNGQGQSAGLARSEEHTSELQSLMRISYAVFCLKKKKKTNNRSNKHE